MFGDLRKRKKPPQVRLCSVPGCKTYGVRDRCSIQCVRQTALAPIPEPLRLNRSQRVPHGRKASTELKVVPAFVRDEIAEWSKLVQEMKLPVVTLGK